MALPPRRCSRHLEAVSCGPRARSTAIPTHAKTMRALDPRMNCPPPDFRVDRDLPRGFLAFYMPLHSAFTPRQQALAAKRTQVLEAAHAGRLPDHLPPSDAVRLAWRIELPAWCRDQ